MRSRMIDSSLIEIKFDFWSLWKAKWLTSKPFHQEIQTNSWCVLLGISACRRIGVSHVPGNKYSIGEGNRNSGGNLRKENDHTFQGICYIVWGEFFTLLFISWQFSHSSLKLTSFFGSTRFQFLGNYLVHQL